MKKSLSAKICVLSVALVCVLAFVGCSGSSTSGTAATVDGAEISEESITNEIQAYRSAHDLTDDEAWAEYLHSHGETPESFREQYIDDDVVKDLVKQKCEELGITVDEGEIDDYVDTMRDYYGCESDDDWTAFLADQGMTEQDYRNNVENTFLSTRLKEQLAKDDESATDDVDNDKKSEIYNSWKEEAKDNANITISEMPQGLPYDVDMSKYTDSASASASTDEQAEAEAD